MKKSEIRLLLAASLLLGAAFAIIGFINTMIAMFFCGVAAFVTVLVNILIRALRGKGGQR